ncbi:MAG: choice-of-anchor J domain-containing protein [Bacteroides sp.]|nr:choice-of-anchor J domain-containing protein [Bacteroides sp.]MCM1379034.1 choice-of-anchor J domain-containing protein [Bacteroides sp.]MCM1445650.1 choice-of-anchor J domain-containing protein [Prevotella sp.]
MKKLLLSLFFVVSTTLFGLASDETTISWSFKLDQTGMSGSLTSSPFELKSNITPNSYKGSWTLSFTNSTNSINSQKDKNSGPRFGSASSPLPTETTLTLSNSSIPENALITNVKFTTKGNAKTSVSTWKLSVNNSEVSDTKTFKSGTSENSIEWQNLNLVGNKIVLTATSIKGGIHLAGVSVTYTEQSSSKSEATLAWSKDSETLKFGDEFVTPTLTKSYQDVAVTYTSDNTALLAVDAVTGAMTLTPNIAGTAKVTASVSADDSKYYATPAIYTLTVIDPNAPTDIYSSTVGEDFEFQNILLSGSLTYVWQKDNNNGYLKASAYVNNIYNETEAIAVSPIIDCSQYKDLQLTFTAAYNFFGSVDSVNNYCSIVAREESDTEWTPIETTLNTDTKLGWTFVDNDPIDLSAYSNKKMQFGFKYISTSEIAGTWEIKNIKVSGKVGTAEPVAPSLKVITSDGQTIENGGDYEIVAGTVVKIEAKNADTTTIIETESNISINGTEWIPDAGVYNPTITATNSVGSANIEFILTVKDNANLAFAENASVTGYVGEKVDALTLSQNPHNVNVKFESSNSDVVALADEMKKLQLLSVGTATITATSEDAVYGGSASYTVTVLPGLGEITLNGVAVENKAEYTFVEGTQLVFAAEGAEEYDVIVIDENAETVIEEEKTGGSYIWMPVATGTYEVSVSAIGRNNVTEVSLTVTITEAPQTSTTILTATNMGVTSTSYGNLASKIDGITYNAYINGSTNNGYMGLKKSEGAIVITVNDEKVCSGISVTQWSGQETSKERQVLVYGSYEPFVTAKDVTADSFTESITVVKLGEAVMSKGEAVKIEMDENTPYYPYLAILSKTDVLQISSIEIEWTKRFEVPEVTANHTGKLSEGGFVEFTIDHAKGTNARIFHAHEPKAAAARTIKRVPSLGSADSWQELIDSSYLRIEQEGDFHVYASDLSGKNRSVITSLSIKDANTTSIEEVEVETATTEYYDLSGRKIAKPIKGIVIKKTGSKVSKYVF